MTSYEALIGRAILSSDPAERQFAEDAVTVKMLASRLIFCQYTARVLDQANTVVIERIADGAPVAVMHADSWDSVKDSPSVVETFTSELYRILDGRVLFAKPAKRPRAARVSPIMGVPLAGIEETGAGPTA